MKDNLVVYCIDIGSERKKNDSHFAWVNSEQKEGKQLQSLATDIIINYKMEKKIAIGFECPLYFELHSKPEEVTKARVVDNNRSWSAGAGAQVLVTGLAQTIWLFNELKKHIEPEVYIMDSWKEFNNKNSGIFIWEAFISNKTNNPMNDNPHLADAQKGLDAFLQCDKNDLVEYDFKKKYFSIIGSVLLRADLAKNDSILCKKCIVIKPQNVK